MSNSKGPIIVVGAGLSGLAAALEIEAMGEECLIIEANAHIGGKLETSVVNEAYRLDRGFQVLLPSYPELQRLNLSELELKFFNSGARLELDGGPCLMANPLRHPRYLASTLFENYATFRDKLLVLKFQYEVLRQDPELLLTTSKGTTLEFLRGYGFSEKMIRAFWAPFFSGVFLESELETSAGFFKYLVRMFASSPVAVPKLGVGELPKLMAQRLKKSEIQLNKNAVLRSDGLTVELSDGRKITARTVIDETKGQTVQASVGPFGQVTSFWFSAPEPPFAGPWLSLNSRGLPSDRLINHVAVLSNVSADYAMKGDALICVNVIRPNERIDFKKMLFEAESILGLSVRDWQLLRTDEILRAFPLYIDRNDSDTPSQQGALLRGRTLARKALETL